MGWEQALKQKNKGALRRHIQMALKHVEIARESLQLIENEELYFHNPDDIEVMKRYLTEIIGDGQEKECNNLISLSEIIQSHELE